MPQNVIHFTTQLGGSTIFQRIPKSIRILKTPSVEMWLLTIQPKTKNNSQIECHNMLSECGNGYTFYLLSRIVIKEINQQIKNF